MNPRTYLAYHWSSLGAYVGNGYDEWLKPERIMTMSPDQYRIFLTDYEGKKSEIEEMKAQLANS